MTLKVTPDFGFEFADGFKWQDEMTREELLVVIQTLLLERQYARDVAHEMAAMARSGV